MNSYKTLSHYLDVCVRHIAKISTLVPRAGLMTGKTGIAILLYNYARYKNDPEIMEYADRLIEVAVQETRPHIGTNFDSGLCGIVWGIDYLVKQEFIQADEEIFKAIESFLFQEMERTLYFTNLGFESEKGLYIWNRFKSCEPSSEKTWHRRMENCIHHFRDILMQRYTNYELLVFPCKSLILFFHVCQTLREHNLYCKEIDALYKELSESVKISYNEEKNASDKYILASLLVGIPMFEKCLPDTIHSQEMTLSDICNLYLIRLILGRSIPMPQNVDEIISSIANDYQSVDKLLQHMKPHNAGLANMGGIVWAILQWSMDQNNF
jgi:hypothetical protein